MTDIRNKIGITKKFDEMRLLSLSKFYISDNSGEVYLHINEKKIISTLDEIRNDNIYGVFYVNNPIFIGDGKLGRYLIVTKSGECCYLTQSKKNLVYLSTEFNDFFGFIIKFLEYDNVDLDGILFMTYL